MSAEKKFKTFADLRLIPSSKSNESPTGKNTVSAEKEHEKEQKFVHSNNESNTTSATRIPSTTSRPSTHSNTRIASTPQEPKSPAQFEPDEAALIVSSVAPIRDFQKVPNSVTRELLSSGLFRGKSKQVYDYLYSVTRGAITPVRSVRKSRKEIQKKSGIGSMVTVDAALVHLESIGLIRVRSAIGSLIGNEYEVFTPEESLNEQTQPLPSIASTSSLSSNPDSSRTTSTATSTANISSSTSPIQILDELDIPENGTSRTTQVIDNYNTSAVAKTLSKTKEEKRIDDEPAAAFRTFNEKLNEVFRQLMGREAKQSDAEALAAIGELLAAEILEAASRTKVVSNAAKFSLTHLRRRLGVRTVKVETISEKETGKGTAAAKPTKREIQLTDDEIQECPDCQGRLLIYPAGAGKGAVMCKHQPLITAKQETTGKEKKH